MGREWVYGPTVAHSPSKPTRTSSQDRSRPYSETQRLEVTPDLSPTPDPVGKAVLGSSLGVLHPWPFRRPNAVTDVPLETGVKDPRTGAGS